MANIEQQTQAPQATDVNEKQRVPVERAKFRALVLANPN